MTKLRAKNLSLKVWKYLAKHPEIPDKLDLPYWLHKQITRKLNECPLCEYFNGKCRFCPLKSCDTSSSLFVKWNIAKNNKDYNTAVLIRRKAAEKIVKKIEAWKVE